MRGLEGLHVIVTGGGGGIGGAICARFIEEGAKVSVLDIEAAAAERVADEIDPKGRRSLAVAVDITDYDAVGEAVDAAADALGPVDVLVNNAGWDRFLCAPAGLYGKYETGIPF